MKLKKTIQHDMIIDPEELKEALVYWLTRSPKNKSKTCQLAAHMNNSDCKFSMSKNKPLKITFTWDEEQETV